MERRSRKRFAGAISQESLFDTDIGHELRYLKMQLYLIEFFYSDPCEQC